MGSCCYPARVLTQNVQLVIAILDEKKWSVLGSLTFDEWWVEVPLPSAEYDRLEAFCRRYGKTPDDAVILFMKYVVEHGEEVAERCKGEEPERLFTELADEATKRMLGVGKNLKFVAEGHDLDECNDEIAGMFGVEN